MSQRAGAVDLEHAPNTPLLDVVLSLLQTGASPFAKEKVQVRLVVTSNWLQFWKKSKKKRLMAVPLSLAWTVRDLQLTKKNKDVDLSCAFEIVLPSQRWPLIAKTEGERNKILYTIDEAIKKYLKIDSLTPERKGIYDYGTHVGVYDGEWLVGQPHGRGRFTSPEGLVFDGDWSSSIAAGYGVTFTQIDGMLSDPKAAGWETFFPDDPPREAHNDVLDSSEGPSGLTDSDVQMIISHSSLRRFGKGDVIFHEGEVNDCLYRIKSGVIRLTQEIDGQTQPRAEMGPDQMFGEMSVLDKNIISATVVAASDLVELYTIELDVLYELFKTCPGFSRRFHHAMAETLASRLLRFFEPKMSRGLRQTFSGPLSNSQSEYNLANTWVDLWNTRGQTAQCYLDLIQYRDPWVPAGIHGKSELQQHLNNLRESGRYWTWEEPSVGLTPDGFRLMTKVQLTSQRNGAVTRQDAIVEVGMNRKENKFKTISVRFDKDLLADQPVSDVRGGASGESQAQHSQKLQDIKYCQRFNLAEGETILFEKPCMMSSSTMSSNVSGVLYMSQQYVCFYSKVFDMKTKEVVPTKAIKSVKMKPAISGILVKYNLKTARKIAKHSDVYGSTGFDKNVELMFTFPANYEQISAEISSLMTKVGASFSKSDKMTQSSSGTSSSSGADVEMDGYRVAKESVIQKFARCSQQHERIPSIPIRRSMNEQGIRLSGPNATETAECYGSDVCGRTVSTYPKLTRMGPDGVAIPVNDERQGDPICDQFCIERMENKVIFALADGCNWGSPPRRAALLAAKTFCEFVRHNLPQTNSLQEAGKLFLHAFAAAHHRILEGFEASKIWECGTTTLLGGAILELAPSAQYVERRWGVVLASVGDCKGFLISSRFKTVVDITIGSRTGTASVDASDCGGRLGPYVGEGNPDLRNLSLFYTPAEEGDICVFTSDGVYDNLDPQSLGITPHELGISDDPNDTWDKQKDWRRVEDAKTEYVCELIREMVFGPKEILPIVEDLASSKISPSPTASTSSLNSIPSSYSTSSKLTNRLSVEMPTVEFTSRDLSPIKSGEQHSMSMSSTPRPINLSPSEIVEKLIQYAITKTASSREFMEKNPDKILPKDYVQYPGKLDHTTCLALKVKRSTFKPVENELDSLVLRMRNPAQGLSTVRTLGGGLGPGLNLGFGKGLSSSSTTPSTHASEVVTLTKGEGLDSPRYSDLDPQLSPHRPTVQYHQRSGSGGNTSGPSSSSRDSTEGPSTPNSGGMPSPHDPLPAPSASGAISIPGHSSATNHGLSSSGGNPVAGQSISPPAISTSPSAGTPLTKKPGMLKRTNTILNVAIRGSVILRWLKENEKMAENEAAKVAQLLLGFRYIRPLDIESWKSETFSHESSYNFQVYEPIMTRNDWEQLLRSSRRVTYPKDTVIIKEGDNSKQQLYYIISGRCRTTKSIVEVSKLEKRKKTPEVAHNSSSSGASSSSGETVNDSTTHEITDPHLAAAATTSAPSNRAQKLMKKTKVRMSDMNQDLKHTVEVSMMFENETFGEISFLFSQKTSAKTSASVVAESDVELYIIEGSWINILFVKYPGMAGRFYHYLASVLAHRLKKQELLESQRRPSSP